MRTVIILSVVGLVSFTATAWAGSSQWFNDWLGTNDFRQASTLRYIGTTKTHNYNATTGRSCTGVKRPGYPADDHCAGAAGIDITKLWCGCVEYYARGGNGGDNNPAHMHFYKEWVGS